MRVERHETLTDSGAVLFSRDRRYRYWLDRRWSEGDGICTFVGLNPSVADAANDDPTIRRCKRFARDWGYQALIMVNLFGLVSTDPTVLAAAEDPVGPLNDAYVGRICDFSDLVVAAWGAEPAAEERAREIVARGVLGDYRVLGLTAAGHPRHPLYMPAASTPLLPSEVPPLRR